VHRGHTVMNPRDKSANRRHWLCEHSARIAAIVRKMNSAVMQAEHHGANPRHQL
jgi:hypothetical protein